MTKTRSVIVVAAGTLCALLLSLGAMSASAATAPSDAAYKAAADTDPHLSLTPYQQQMLVLKDKLAANALSGKATAATMKANLSAVGVNSASALAAVSAAGTGMPASESVAKTQTPQRTSYWCGPATVHEALAQLGAWVTQADLAPELGTTTAGTAWSGGPTSTGHPVPDVLNKHQSFYYVPIGVPSSPGSQDVAYFKNRLTADIWWVGAPVIGNAWEVHDGKRLTGHPNPREGTGIFHWFDIYGYANSGATTLYEDSVHGATSISWASDVPAYSALPSSDIARIIGGRGYVW